jgi:hypothetical protein
MFSQDKFESQGDQIGRIRNPWLIVYLGYFFLN